MKFTHLLLAAATLLAAGCATEESSRPAPQPGEGLAEHRQLLRRASQAIAQARSCLDRVSAQTNPCPPRLVAALAEQVQDLQVKSLKVRSRWQAMQARGEAYFEHWQESLARVKDPKVRELAAGHRAELQQSFARLKANAQQAREAFNPFLAGLRSLQLALEKDPGSLRTESNQQLLQTTRDQGGRVEEALAALRREIDSMAALLTPGKTASKP